MSGDNEKMYVDPPSDSSDEYSLSGSDSIVKRSSTYGHYSMNLADEKHVTVMTMHD